MPKLERERLGRLILRKSARQMNCDWSVLKNEKPNKIQIIRKLSTLKNCIIQRSKPHNLQMETSGENEALSDEPASRADQQPGQSNSINFV